jgi:hypothetical protein
MSWLVTIRLISEPRTTISFLILGFSTTSHFSGNSELSWALAAPVKLINNTASINISWHQYAIVQNAFFMENPPVV